MGFTRVTHSDQLRIWPGSKEDLDLNRYKLCVSLLPFISSLFFFFVRPLAGSQRATNERKELGDYGFVEWDFKATRYHPRGVPQGQGYAPDSVGGGGDVDRRGGAILFEGCHHGATIQREGCHE